MDTKGYNPLNEGYTGKSPQEKGYTGSGNSNSTSEAPTTITNVQSGVIKPAETQASTSSDRCCKCFNQRFNCNTGKLLCCYYCL